MMVYISDYCEKVCRLVFLILVAHTFMTDGNNESSVSIVFVLDTTGSMKDVLRQFRTRALSILEGIERVEHNITSFNYVLVPFSDPDLGSVVITSDKKELLAALNGITTTGGGDCPEPSLTALKRGLEVAGNRSHVFLFTDADAKEGVISDELQDMIKTKKPSLYLFIAGNCTKEPDPIYEQLALMSKGQYIKVEKGEVGFLLNKIIFSAKNLSQLSVELPLSKIIFTQRPSIAFENENILLNCSLSPQTHIESSSPIKLTIYFNGRQQILREKHIRNTQNGSILYRINSGDHHVHGGEYECVASRQSVASDSIESVVVKIVLRVESKDHVQRKTETLPVIKGNEKSVSCPLNFTNNQNAILGWQKNDYIIEDPNMKVLNIDPAETHSLQSLKCFRIDKTLKTKEEVTYNIILGEKPLLTTSAIHDEFINKTILSCDVVVKHLSSIQIFDGTMGRAIADSRDDNFDLHMEHLRFTRDHHIFKLFLTTEEYLSYKQPFSCVVHSLFGSKQEKISVDGIKTHTERGTKNLHYATGAITSLTSSDIPKRHVRVPFTRHTTESCFKWSPFSPCSVTCGTGFRTRTRSCLRPNRKCNETNFEVQMCHLPPCSNTKDTPEPLRIGPEVVEWMGHVFDPYKDKEYNENGIKRCTKGFTLDIFKDRCVDVNECKIRNKCPKGMRCVNTRGSFKCMTCPKGFMGINGHCFDINECSLKTHKCSQICVNVYGSYRCDCKNGFQLHSDGLACEYLGFH